MVLHENLHIYEKWMTTVYYQKGGKPNVLLNLENSKN